MFLKFSLIDHLNILKTFALIQSMVIKNAGEWGQDARNPLLHVALNRTCTVGT